jgi:diguanylate cyclase
MLSVVVAMFPKLFARSETERHVAAEPQLGGREAMELTVLELAASDDPRSIFVAAFGLDRFDRLRAVIGYGAVTELMEQLSARLGQMEADWRIGRVSDDVLGAAFLAAGISEAEQRVATARARLQGAYHAGGHPIDIRLTAGLSLAGPPRALMREADVALDMARSERVELRVFDPSGHAKAIGALSLMPELRCALEADQLHLVHQPKFDLRTGRVTGAETLVRWIHPAFGNIEPDTFVRLAEETADIHALTHWVFERAIKEQRQLAEDGYPLQFAVNLSGRLVSDEAIIRRIIELGHRFPGALRVEITETAVIDQPGHAFANVARLSEAGVPCSIDDFGAGLSSIAYLKRLQADELKLDKSLVDDFTSSSRDVLITRSIVDLAHSLGMKVVAEGIETVETAAVATSLGCDIGQGFLLGRPTSLNGLASLLGENTDRQHESRASCEARTSSGPLDEVEDTGDLVDKRRVPTLRFGA